MVYSGYFASREDVEREFAEKLSDDVEILVADYNCEDYEGHAYVLFQQNDKFYEVHGGHCSCYGLEGQWNPDEVVPVQIKYIRDNGTLYSKLSSDVQAVIDEMITRAYGA